MFEKMNEWSTSPELQAEFKRVGDYVGHIIEQQHHKFKAERRHGVFMNKETQNPDLEFI